MNSSPLEANTSGRSWLAQELAALQQAGLWRRRRELTLLPQGRCRVDGRELWNFAANDYLGLADDPRVIAAAVQAAEECGIGARASGLVTGRTEWHAQLERELAVLKHADACVLFPTGYAANVGTITALVGRDDVVWCDRLNHASLVDGCRLSGAKLRVYPHLDVAALEQDLRKFGNARRRLIVTDAMFSMDGDLAPLLELAHLAEAYDATLLVDEAHATGVLGSQGGGLWQQCLESDESLQRLTERVICVGTLSKACGAQGGFVTGSQALCDWLWNSARMQMFSTALAVPICAAAAEAVRIIRGAADERQQLVSMSALVLNALGDQGWEIPDRAVGPIIPVLTKTPERTLLLIESLEQRGVLVAGIRPPTVPRGTSRLRISLSTSHGMEGVAALLKSFDEVRTTC